MFLSFGGGASLGTPKLMFSEEWHTLKMMGWGNASLTSPGLQKELFMPLLYKQMSFISGIISLPQLVDA